MDSSERTFLIYCHTSPSGKRYVGQTCKSLEARYNNGYGYRECTYFYRAISKYGWENFRHDILAVCHYKSVADLLEQHYISKYDTFNPNHGYNLTRGGGGVLGCTWSEERKKAKSESIRGANNFMYGRHHTEESRRKMSEKLKQVVVSPEMREFRTNVLLESNKKRQVAINQYDPDGNLIATYDGFGEMERVTGFGHSLVVNACSGRNETAYGFKWEYVDNDLRSRAEQVRADRLAKKQARTRRGEGTGGMAVIQFDTDGNEIARYPSLSAAERKTGFHRDRIGDCCHGGLETYEGYVWRFANDGQMGADKVHVRQRDLNGNEIATFESIAKASAATSIPRYQIRNCCRGRTNTSHGFKWEYVDDDRLQNRPKPRVGVVQLDMDGNEVGVYESLASAMRETGHDRHRIVECCKGERESYRGFMWRYKEAA